MSFARARGISAVASVVARRHCRPTLKCSRPLRHGMNQSRSFALAVNVGHGNKAKAEPPITYQRSPEQDKAALAEHKRMLRVTQRLLNLEVLTSRSVQELRVVFQYWTGARSRVFDATRHNEAKQPALEYAKALLEKMLSSQTDPDMLRTVFETDECVTGAVVNMIEQYLMPFRGTYQSMKTTAERRLRSRQNVPELKAALTEATMLMDRLQDLLNDPSLPKLVHDKILCNMDINLWAKRCWFLAEHGEAVDDDFVHVALKGVSSVEECLKVMKRSMETLPSPDPLSNLNLYLSAWVNSGLPNRAQEAHSILKKAEEDPSIALNTGAYNAVLHTYASLVEQDKSNVTNAAELLKHMWNDGIECDVASYSSLLLAYSKARDPDGAMEFLMQMERAAAKTQLFPNAICYNIVLDALAKHGTEEAAFRAEALLERMQEMSDNGSNPFSSPDTVSFTSVIQAWSRSASTQAAEKAEALLLQFRELSMKNKNVAPDIVMYNMVLHCWAEHNSKQRSKREMPRVDDTGARRAESLLRRMKTTDGVGLDVYSYNIVMNAWSNSGNNQVAARRARELFKEMKDAYHAGDFKLKPDVITYNTVIKLIARSGIRGCVDEARSRMKEMEGEGYRINVVTCNTVMAATAKYGGRDAVQKAEDMLNEMEELYKNGNKYVRPGEITFNILLHAYAKSKNPADVEKAEKLLNRMIERSDKNNGEDAMSPSIKTFATVLDAYANTGQSEKAEALFDKMAASGKVKVNSITFNTVLNALAKSREPDAPYRAEALLNRMQEEYEAGNDDVKPNGVSFSSLLNSWAKSDLEFAAERAEAILNRMEDLAARGNPDVAPNPVCYSTVIHAWSRSGASNSAERAMSILTRMEDEYRNGQKDVKPNSYCFNATMNAVAKSSLSDKAEKCYELLHRMIRSYNEGNESARPSVTSFSTVLNACAYTNGTQKQQKEAFRIARTTLAEFLESDYGEPNVVTFVNFLTACSKLLPEGAVRDNLMGAAFRECIQNDFVNGKVVNILRRSVSPEVFHENMAGVKRPAVSRIESSMPL